jgi:hypothetical protein
MQPIYEGKGFFSEISDTKWSWKRGRMKKNTRPTRWALGRIIAYIRRRQIITDPELGPPLLLLHRFFAASEEQGLPYSMHLRRAG